MHRNQHIGMNSKHELRYDLLLSWHIASIVLAPQRAQAFHSPYFAYKVSILHTPIANTAPKCTRNFKPLGRIRHFQLNQLQPQCAMYKKWKIAESYKFVEVRELKAPAIQETPVIGAS